MNLSKDSGATSIMAYLGGYLQNSVLGERTLGYVDFFLGRFPSVRVHSARSANG